MASRRGKHQGVTLVKPYGRNGWRVRYADPDTGIQIKRSIPPDWSRTIALRGDYADRLSRQLEKRREALEGGAPKITGTPLADTIERYYTERPHRARAEETYRGATDRLVDWAAKHKVKNADDLTRPKLAAFHAHLVNAPKQYSTSGKQGAKAKGTTRRAGATINKEIRAIRRVLGYLINRDHFARLTHDDLRRVLEAEPVTVDRPTYLKPAELKRLFEAAERHDSDTYALTRDERRAGKTQGETPRYDPIAPFVAFVALTGMRLNEAVDLTWAAVDLEAMDVNGARVGEIYLKGADNKTKRGRVVRLDISPACRRLLAAQRIKRGGEGNVWGVSRETAVKAMRRLRKTYGAPAAFTWQVLRSTCDSYLNSAPAIYGANAAFRAAKQLGHGVAISERYYADPIAGLSRNARDIETAMRISAEVDAVIERLSEPAPRKVVALR